VPISRSKNAGVSFCEHSVSPSFSALARIVPRYRWARFWLTSLHSASSNILLGKNVRLNRAVMNGGTPSVMTVSVPINSHRFRWDVGPPALAVLAAQCFEQAVDRADARPSVARVFRGEVQQVSVVREIIRADGGG
jgi:hypothetical protein